MRSGETNKNLATNQRVGRSNRSGRAIQNMHLGQSSDWPFCFLWGEDVDLAKRLFFASSMLVSSAVEKCFRLRVGQLLPIHAN